MSNQETRLIKSKSFWINFFAIVLIFTGFIMYKVDSRTMIQTEDPYRSAALLAYFKFVFGGVVQAAIAAFGIWIYEFVTYMIFGLKRRFSLTERFLWIIVVPFNFIFYYAVMVRRIDSVGLSMILCGVFSGLLATGFQLYVLDDKSKLRRGTLFFLQFVWGWIALLGLAFVQTKWLAYTLESTNQISKYL